MLASSQDVLEVSETLQCRQSASHSREVSVEMPPGRILVVE